jgi:hypothetical protein
LLSTTEGVFGADVSGMGVSGVEIESGGTDEPASCAKTGTRGVTMKERIIKKTVTLANFDSPNQDDSISIYSFVKY